MIERQLQLLDPPEPDWELDEQTKAIGRRGVARARATLIAARRSALTIDNRPEGS